MVADAEVLTAHAGVVEGPDDAEISREGRGGLAVEDVLLFGGDEGAAEVDDGAELVGVFEEGFAVVCGT